MPQYQYPPPELPLTKIPTAHSTHNAQAGSSNLGLNHPLSHSSNTIHNASSPFDISDEKSAPMTRPGGRRRRQNSSPGDTSAQSDSSLPLTKFGILYSKILTYGTGTRYSIYIIPVALIFLIPIVVSSTQVSRRDPRIGGVRLVWFFTWLESVWLSLWASIFVSRLLPSIFRYLIGVVSPKTKKYARVLSNLQGCVATLLWVIVSFVLYEVLFSTASAGNNPGAWTATFKKVLAAILVSTIIFTIEKFFVQFVSVSYHARSFNYRIEEAKRAVKLLSELFEASRTLFPMYGEAFWEEDDIIKPGIESYVRKGRYAGHRVSQEGVEKSGKRKRAFRGMGAVSEKVQSMFGNIAAELTGKSTLLPERSAQRFVVDALEKVRSSRALAQRLWFSFVMEGNDCLQRSDLEDVLGDDHHEMAEQCFLLIDPDENGDVTLDEMVLKVVELCNERKAIARSMHDVSQAIKALDSTLVAVALLLSTFALICFLDQGFSSILTTASTTLLSLSFVFSVTAQEFLGSCIFLFVKHPYDISDRVHISGPDGINQLEVEQISLLYTSFKRITDLELIQIPNSVLNTLWINNVTRAKALLERIDMYISFDTSMEDIEALRAEMEAFVSHEDNKREFQPDVVLRCMGVGSMDKLQLQLQVRHKSNWFVEHIRATRHSKLMCALVLAMRKVPIKGPGGGGAALGDPTNPAYSVAISDAQATSIREKAAKAADAARLHPVNTPDVKDNLTEDKLRYRGRGKSSAGNEHEALASIPESLAAAALNDINLSEDPLRDDNENDSISITRDQIAEHSITSEPTNDNSLTLKKSKSAQGRRKPGLTVSSQSSNPGVGAGLEIVPTNASHASRISDGHFDPEAQRRV